MYISLWENYRGHTDNISFMQFSTKNWWFRTKRFTGLWELIQLLWTIPIREIFHFHHLPKLYFGFNICCSKRRNMLCTFFTTFVGQQPTYFTVKNNNTISTSKICHDIEHQKSIQWNLVITRSLGPWKLPCYIRFLIISG